MTRFKKELLKRGKTLEESLPYLPYHHIEAIIVHADTCSVSTYDNRIGWYYEYYDRHMEVYKVEDEDTIENIDQYIFRDTDSVIERR